MPPETTAWKQYQTLVYVVIIFLLLSCCDFIPNPCCYDEIRLGMTMKEVRSILGPPDKTSSMGFEYHCRDTLIIIEFSKGLVVNVGVY